MEWLLAILFALFIIAMVATCLCLDLRDLRRRRHADESRRGFSVLPPFPDKPDSTAR